MMMSGFFYVWVFVICTGKHAFSHAFNKFCNYYLIFYIFMSGIELIRAIPIICANKKKMWQQQNNCNDNGYSSMEYYQKGECMREAKVTIN